MKEILFALYLLPAIVPLFHTSDFQLLQQYNRPQTPQPPFPYRMEEVAYQNRIDGVHIAGTLTYPDGEGPFPAAILISGSGQQDRDETVFGHKPFWVIADYLTRRGIAVLRYDDRGVGGTTAENLANATSEDFARDALAGVDYLLARPEIDPMRIGFIGHSEGGMIGPLAAIQSDDMAFVVMLAGPGESGAKILLDQNALISRAEGLPEEYIAVIQGEISRVIDVALTEPNESAGQAKIRDIVDETRPMLSQRDRLEISSQYYIYLVPWFRYFLAYDPYPVLAQLQIPVLAINGDKDLQVPYKSNLQGIEQALSDGGNTNFKIQSLPNLNHFFQTTETGAISEYETLEETFSPVALKIVGDWLAEITHPAVVADWMCY